MNAKGTFTKSMHMHAPFQNMLKKQVLKKQVLKKQVLKKQVQRKQISMYKAVVCFTQGLTLNGVLDL